MRKHHLFKSGKEMYRLNDAQVSQYRCKSFRLEYMAGLCNSTLSSFEKCLEVEVTYTTNRSTASKAILAYLQTQQALVNGSYCLS